MARPKPVKIVQMNLRIHEDLRDKIKTEADKRGLSINREMERRLEQSVRREEIEAIVTDAVTRAVITMSTALEPRLSFMASQLNLITKHMMEKLDD